MTHIWFIFFIVIKATAASKQTTHVGCSFRKPKTQPNIHHFNLENYVIVLENRNNVELVQLMVNLLLLTRFSPTRLDRFSCFGRKSISNTYLLVVGVAMRCVAWKLFARAQFFFLSLLPSNFRYCRRRCVRKET